MGIINNLLNDKIMKHLLIATITYVFISIFVASYTLSFLSIMLGWNIILAFVPVFLAYSFRNICKVENDQKSKTVILIIIFLIWLAFFPNSYYVITDFIHLGGERFYYQTGMYTGYTYTENLIGYLMLTHIFLGAFLSVVMASYSLKMMHQFFIDKYSNLISIGIITVILILSSIGIYIGRFLRLNSWELVRPFAVIGELFQNLNIFAFQFILIFTLIQMAVYFFIRPFLVINKL